MNTKLRRLIPALLFLLAVCPSSPASAFFGGGYGSLGDLAHDAAKEMQENYLGKKIYLDRENLRDAASGEPCNFSGLLANELERALSEAGFVFEPFFADRADYALSAEFNKGADSVQVYFRVTKTQGEATQAALKGRYLIALKHIPPDCFLESLDTRLSRLANRLTRNLSGRDLTLFVNPVVEGRKKYASEFSTYATRKLKTLLASNNKVKVMGERPTMRKMGEVKSGSRSLEAGDATLAGANAVLDGEYLPEMNGVNLSLSLKGLDGSVLAGADDTIPRNLVHFRMENDDAEQLSMIVDSEHESSGGMVRIGTTKGGRYQVFHDGEVVQFTIQVAKPLYIYIYDINPRGGVSLLYPKPGDQEAAVLPGTVHTLPKESDPWEIRVEPPYGTDAVKVFASDRRLPIPTVSAHVATRSFSGGTRSLGRVDKVQAEIAGQPAINGLDLVDYYKGVAAKTGALLFDSTVYVETRAK